MPDFFAPSPHHRELDYVQQLFRWVHAREEDFNEDPSSIRARVAPHYSRQPPHLVEAVDVLIDELVRREPLLYGTPDCDYARLSLTEQIEYRKELEAKRDFFERQDYYLDQLEEAVGRAVLGIVVELPQMDAPSPFTIPLIYALPDPRIMVEKTCTVFADYYAVGWLRRWANRVFYNQCAYWGIDPRQPLKKPLPRPSEAKLPLEELVDTFLAGTPFQEFFRTPVPLRFTTRDRMNHMMVVGGPDSGKTTLLEMMFAYDVASPSQPSIVIIEPHAAIVQSILEADIDLKDRLIYISPRDPPGLNLFSLNEERLATYDEHTRDEVLAGVTQTFTYLFSELGGGTGQLTSKQQILFTFCTQLLVSFPQALGRTATVNDFLELLTCDKRTQLPDDFARAIEALPPLARSFFLRDFLGGTTFSGTKEEIRYRIMGVLANGTMRKLFMAERTTIDLYAALNSGKIILVDTDKGFLKDASSDFGKLFIAVMLQCIMERTALPSSERRDTFLIVDEASDYFSTKVDDLLTEVRKFRCGCVFAFQFLSQASPTLRASLLGATGMKFTAQLATHDAKVMAPEMRTTTDYLMDQPRFTFAAHIRHVTRQAVSIPVAPVLERLGKRSRRELDALLDRNRRALSPPAAGTQLWIEMSSVTPADDKDISPKW